VSNFTIISSKAGHVYLSGGSVITARVIIVDIIDREIKPVEPDFSGWSPDGIFS